MALLTLLTLGLSFWAVSFGFNRGQERQLDEALLGEALRAAEKAVTPDGDYAVADGPGPDVNDAGPMPLYGAVYDAHGAVRAATATFGGAPPSPDASLATSRPFDFTHGRVRLRGVMVPVPTRPGATLLLSTPRTDLDGDAAFLGHAMLVVFAVACVWSLLVPIWLIHRLTRDQEAIADVVLRVAAGDLRARVDSRSSDPEIQRLAGAVDTMIGRLGLLLSSQQRFVAHAAHELRAPITVVQGQLALALRRPRGEEEYREAIREALGSAGDLRALTDELLDFARAGAGSAGPFAPTSIARAARESARYVLADAERAGVTVDLSVGDALVPGRPEDLARLLRNLVENAVRHSPPGGRVLVESGTGRAGIVEIAVSDEGSGVPLAERERIFEPFFRGVAARGSAGTGLGLAIVRAIARAHGGDIQLDAAATRGARFVVRLPLAELPAAELAPSGSVAPVLHPS
jgi:two-component system heavy metal sensor histidine kinase CusS